MFDNLKKAIPGLWIVLALVYLIVNDRVYIFFGEVTPSLLCILISVAYKFLYRLDKISSDRPK
jgi:hypothetical protein